MKTLLAVTVVAALTTPVQALEPYVGIYGSSNDHDKTLYNNQTHYNGASIGVTQVLTNTPFFVRLEGAGTEHKLSPVAGFGIQGDTWKLTIGKGKGEERATYNFTAPFVNSNQQTDTYTFDFIDLEYNGLFLRYSRFDVNFDFLGGAMTELGPVSTTVHIEETRGVTQLGYRVRF